MGQTPTRNRTGCRLGRTQRPVCARTAAGKRILAVALVPPIPSSTVEIIGRVSIAAVVGRLVAAGEALMLAKQSGLDLAKSFEAILNSSGNSFVHETESQVILDGSFGFTMDLACKDLGFATQLGREFGVPLELAAMVEQTFIRARSQYGGGAWPSQVVKLLEDALGAELRAPGFPEALR